MGVFDEAIAELSAQSSFDEPALTGDPAGNIFDEASAEYDEQDKGFVSNVKSSYRHGQALTDLGLLRSRQLFGEDSDEIRTGITDAKKRMDDTEADIGKGNFAERAVNYAADMAPMMIESFKKGTTRGLAMGMGAGTITALAGQAGPQVAFPEEIITVPAAFAGMYGVGTISGSMETAGKIEAGLAYDELLDLKDEQGNRLDPSLAKGAAASVGVINGLIEVAQIKTLLKTIPGGEKLLRGAIRETVTDALKSGTLKQIALRAAGRYAGAVATETGQEVLQETTNILASEVVKRLDESSDIAPATLQEIAGRITDVAKQSAMGFGVMAAPGTVTTTARDISSRRSARTELLDHGEEGTTAKEILTGEKEAPPVEASPEMTPRSPMQEQEPLAPEDTIDADEAVSAFDEAELAMAAEAETKEVTDDSQDKTGIPSEEPQGREPVEVKPNRGGGEEAVETDRVFQEEPDEITDEPVKQIEIPEEEKQRLEDLNFDGKKTAEELGEQQKLVITGGPPGAGKSSGMDALGLDDKKMVRADADRVKKQAGYEDRAGEFHEASSEVNKRIARRAIDNDYHLIYDSLMTNYPLANGLVQEALGKDGEVFISFTNIDSITSVVRSKARVEGGISKRKIPEDASVKGYNRALPTFIELYNKYKNDPRVRFSLIDNNVDGREAVPVFIKTQDGQEIFNQDLFDKLMNTAYSKIEKEGEVRYERTNPFTVKDLEPHRSDIKQRTAVIVKAIREEQARKEAEKHDGRLRQELRKSGVQDQASRSITAGTPAAESKPVKKLTYDEFKKAYTTAFKNMNKYTLEQAGSNIYAEEMAKLSDEYPGWAEKVEQESTPKETKRQKAEREYREFIKGLTDEEKQAAGKLVINNPGSPSVQKTKIKKAIAKAQEKQADLPRAETVTKPSETVASAKDEALKKEPGKTSDIKTGSSDKLASWVEQKLEAGKFFNWRELFKEADNAFGGTQAEGEYTPKDAYDSVELGVNRYIQRHSQVYDPRYARVKQATDIISKLKELTEIIPTQTKRTREQQEFQQFSTPPGFAYAASWVANIENDDVVMEPSAGVGGLAVFADNAGADVIVNELSPRRADLLKLLGFGKVFSENAEQLDNILPIDVKPTVIIMNPPFSATAGRVAKNKTKYGARHIEQALARLEDGGRLVAIVGKGMADNTPAFKQWWNRINGKYTVRANIGVSGKDYTKYGTSFANQLVVIDKIGPSNQAPLTGFVESFEELPALLGEVRNERKRTLASEQTGGKVAETRESATVEERDSGDSTFEVVSGREEPKHQASSERRPGGTNTGADNDATLRPAEGGEALGVEQPGQPAREPNGEAVSGGATGTGERPSTREETVATTTSKKRAKKELSDSIYEVYQPKVKIAKSRKHPTPLVESAAMADTEAPDIKYKPHLPKEVVQGRSKDDSNGLSDIQLEAVTYAGQAHSQTLANGNRKGFFIGDGTGVGKGREISGIIYDNWNQGRKKAVWVSENWDLLKDAQRDLRDTGWSEGADSVFAHKKHKAGTSIKAGEGILFSTYSTIRSGFNKLINVEEESSYRDLNARANQIVDWLGEDFDGVIAFDESHNMQNAAPQAGDRGVKPPSQQALASIFLQNRLPNARVVYVSATGATEVNNLIYAERLGLWGENTAFRDSREFVNKISSGGIATMEMIARNMKSLGLYLARSLSYADVKYSRLTHDLNKSQRAKYDELARAWQIVLKNIAEAIEITGSNKAGAGYSAFWGAHQRFFNQVITTMQLPSAIKKIKRDVENGYSVILQMVNTDEAQQERALSRREVDQDLEDLDMTPRENLIGYLQKSFPVQEYEEYTDENGNTAKRPVYDSEGRPVTNREAEAMRDRLIARVSSIKMPSGPLEYIIQELGHENVAEITGRSRRVVTDVKSGKKVIEKRSDKIAAADVDDFINDRKQILVFSGKGATGRSFHADKNYKNKRQRKHYLIQPGWRADKAVQGLGRSHRSNQVSSPEFVLVTTDLEGQKRFLSSVARRLDQLGALTKGQRQTGSQGIFQARDNLESAYARDALVQYMDEIVAGHAGITVEDFEDQTGLNITGEGSEYPSIVKFLNRLLSLEIDTQAIVFNGFSKKLDQIIQSAEDAGTLDVGIETIRGDSVKKVSEETVYTDEDTGAETKYVQVDVTNPANNISYARSKTVFYKSRGYYRNVRSGKIWVSSPVREKTDSTGDIVEYVVLVSPQNTHQTKSLEEVDSDKWEKITGKQAASIWTDEYESLPKTTTNRHHLITGNLLPIWDRLQGTPTIRRMQTDDGERFLGRSIPTKNLEDTLGALDIAAGRVEHSGKEVAEKVLFQDAKVRLSGGWKIKRSMVSGDDRVELLGPEYDDLDYLENIGVMEEVINWSTRFFIPTKKAAGIIDKIVKKKLIVGIDMPRGGERLETRLKADPEEGTDRTKRTMAQDVTTATNLKKAADIVLRAMRASGISPEAIKRISVELKPVIDLRGRNVEKTLQQWAKQGKQASRILGATTINRLNATIELSLEQNWDKMEHTAYHESFHVGAAWVLPKPQYDALMKFYGGNEEKAADEFADYMMGKKLASKPTGLVRSAINTLRNFFRKLGGFLKGAGFTTPEQIFGDLASGKFTGVKEGGDGTQVAFSVEDETKLQISERRLDENRPGPERKTSPSGSYNKPPQTSDVMDTVFPSEVSDRMKAAKGVPKKKFIQRIKDWAVDMSHQRRHFPELSRIKDKDERARVNDILRRHQEIPEVAKSEAIQMISDLSRGLSEDEYTTFRLHILMSDMMRDVKSGLLEDGKLPFGFGTVQEVEESFAKLDDIAQKSEAIKDALKRRADAVNKLKKQLVKYKILKKEVLDEDAYFHHQVLQYWGEDHKGTGTSSGDVRTHWRGWMKARKGSTLDYNTEYAQAEFAAVSQQIAQIETAKTLAKLKKESDIYKNLHAEAKRLNVQAIKDMDWGKDDKGKDVDPLMPFRQKIAMSTQKLGKMAQDGTLEYDSEFQDVVDELIEAMVVSKEEGGPLIVDHPRWFHFLSDLINHKRSGSGPAATIFKAIKDRDKFIKDTLGDQFKTYKHVIPEGYVEWKPQPGKAWFWTNTYADSVMQKMISGEISPNDAEVRKVLTRGRDLIWVIPHGLADTMDNFRDYKDVSAIGQAADWAMRAWKQYILLNPYSVLKYNINNTSGDLDATLAYAPTIAAKYAIPAAKDLAKWHRRKSDPDIKKQLQKAQALGVVGSGFSVQEVDDVLKILSSDREIRGIILDEKPNYFNPKTWGEKYWQMAKGVTAWRENILRLAAYRYFLDNKDKRLYGASKPEEVNAITNPEERAAKLARELLGDYGNISRTGEWVRKKLIPFYSWCVPEYTEILTRRGWKKYNELIIGEEALTYNLETRVTEWQNVESKAAYQFDGNLVTIQNSYGFKYQFTEDHRVVVIEKYKDQRKIVLAKDLKSHQHIPVVAPHQFVGDSVLSETESALLGWLVTDGYFRTRKYSPNSFEAVLYQKKAADVESIREKFSEYISSESIHPDTGVICFRLKANKLKTIRKLLKSKDDLPEIVTRLGKNECKAMYEAMLSAEGTATNRFVAFPQNNGPVLDSFQILCYMLGKAGHIRPKICGNKFGTDNEHSSIYVKSRDKIQLYKWQNTREKYSGMVWCPKTSNSTWVMRQNGKVMITGNCEINAPRYVYMMRNTKYENRDVGAIKTRAGAVAAKKLILSATGLAIRAQALFFMIHLWNHLMFPDEEDEMGDQDRRQLHIILGRREDGKILTLRFQGAWSDALSFFGLEDWPSDLKDVIGGVSTVGEKLKEAGAALANRFAQGIRPEVKMFAETATGYKLYPDIFRPLPNRDRVENLLKTFKLDKIYRYATGKPGRGQTMAEHFISDLSTLLVYGNDPGEMAYYDTRKMVFDWLANQGIERSYGKPTRKGNALYYYRQALKYGDLNAAEKYLEQYYDMGGTPKTLRQSLKRANPLSSISKSDRYKFRRSLTPKQNETVQTALEWYKKTYLK